MPGIQSLNAQQYYAHPRNAFWPIMENLFSIEADLPYAQRCDQLVAAGIAVWDVLQGCYREGSLDSAIVPATEVANDFVTLFKNHPELRSVFFNGAKAESAFRKHLGGKLDEFELTFSRLPSTSPAHAAKTLEQKLEAWGEAITPVLAARRQ